MFQYNRIAENLPLAQNHKKVTNVTFLSKAGPVMLRKQGKFGHLSV